MASEHLGGVSPEIDRKKEWGLKRVMIITNGEGERLVKQVKENYFKTRQ